MSILAAAILSLGMMASACIIASAIENDHQLAERYVEAKIKADKYKSWWLARRANHETCERDLSQALSKESGSGRSDKTS